MVFGRFDPFRVVFVSFGLLRGGKTIVFVDVPVEDDVRYRRKTGRLDFELGNMIERALT